MKNTSDLCQKPLNLRVLVFEHAQEKDIAKQCPLPKGKGLIFLDISLTTREFLYLSFNSLCRKFMEFRNFLAPKPLKKNFSSTKQNKYEQGKKKMYEEDSDSDSDKSSKSDVDDFDEELKDMEEEDSSDEDEEE